MESKLTMDAIIGAFETTFNRTSMESKRLRCLFKMVTACTLLIEPVWNRNRYSDFQHRVGIQLLIEPVWNRNFAELNLVKTEGWLLIEPVWNRNVPVPVHRS